MSNSLFKGKSTRTKIYTAITIVAIVLLLALNMVLTVVGDNFLIFFDMTPEGFYTMSDNMEEYCEELLSNEAIGDKEIEIIFCTDPDVLEGSYSLRPTYFMALALRNKFDNVKVPEPINVSVNPAALTTRFSTTSHREIKPTDVIITYDGRYRITDATTFWTQDNFSYNGEYRMASIIASLTSQNAPAAYFVTNHGETYYDPADPSSEMSKSMATAAELLEDRGLTVKTLSLKGLSSIPDDCALLIINAPTSDLESDPTQYNSFSYRSESEVIDRYLKEKSGSIIINKAYDVTGLDNLEALAEEWGISFGNSLVKDEGSSLDMNDHSKLVGVYGDDESFGSAYYGDYAGLSTAPKMIFTNSGYLETTYYPATEKTESGGFNTKKTYAEFITTSDKAVSYDVNGIADTNAGVKHLAAASVRTVLDSETAETTYSYMFCTNTADFFSNEILGNSSYANYDIMASVISSIARFDRYASMSLGGLSQNSPSYGGKQTHSTTLSATATEVWSPDAKELIKINAAFETWHQVLFLVLITLVPLTASVFGIVVRVKRKNL